MMRVLCVEISGYWRGTLVFMGPFALYIETSFFPVVLGLLFFNSIFIYSSSFHLHFISFLVCFLSRFSVSLFSGCFHHQSSVYERVSERLRKENQECINTHPIPYILAIVDHMSR